MPTQWSGARSRGGRGRRAEAKTLSIRDAGRLTGAGSWAAATPKRVIEMTAEIIGGGACKYTFVVVKMPQIRAIRPVQADAGLKAKVKIYRSRRDASHMVYGRRTLWWTPGPRTPLFLC